jgi:recombinational DNA repair protein RecR
MIKHCYECNDNNEAGELLDIIQLNDDYTVMDLIESTDNLINILKKVIITQELMQFQQNTIDDIINYIKSKGVSDIMHINYIIEFFFDLDTNDQIYINDTQRDIIKKLWNKRHNLQ